MTKEEAINYIQNSDANSFNIQIRKTNRQICDLCKQVTEREFFISAKHIGEEVGKKGYKFKKSKYQRITKHICVDCFVKLFPDSLQ